MKILVTAGGTKEFIDGVRYIGNSSSGKTGAQLVNHLSNQGHEVTWLGAESAIKPNQPVTEIEYETFDELACAFKNILSEHRFDLVFHAAAVSDFKVASVTLNGQHFAAGRAVKLPTANKVTLELIQQPKLLASIKAWSLNSEIKVVAFKLTNSKDPAVRQAAIEKLIHQSAVDAVAHNDLNDMTETTHGFCLYTQLEQSESCINIQALADAAILTTMEVA